MDGDGGDAVVVDEDRCLSLPDLRRMKMDPWWMSSPSRSLPKVRFLRFLGVLYVVSLIRLHGEKLFEAAVLRACIRLESLNSLESPNGVGFLLVLLIFSK